MQSHELRHGTIDSNIGFKVVIAFCLINLERVNLPRNVVKARGKHHKVCVQ